MKIKDFDSRVAKTEGKKTQTSMANVREVRSIINKMLKGKLNQLIRAMK